MYGRIVSYHSGIEAEINLSLLSKRPLGYKDFLAVTRSEAVLLPQFCRPDLYNLIRVLNKPHFPRPAIHLNLDGKVGNYLLFRYLGLPQPRALAFSCLNDAVQAWQNGKFIKMGLNFPLVVKGAGGGEGCNVFLVNSVLELVDLEQYLNTKCFYGPSGLVVQELVASNGRDLRILLVGNYQEAYWRLSRRPEEFRTNLSLGGYVKRYLWPVEIKAGLQLVLVLQSKMQLDVVGVDVLISSDGYPLLLELNFYFGHQALGGLDVLRQLWLNAVRCWLVSLGLDSKRVYEAK